ncbi:MAG: LPS export ABC transporter ATP-binding protein [Crocinitomicaceae bacterium]|nr:LPS export ABC transporter ATP-binding protein [Crocinitomicaceae bacterium]
MKLSAKNIHKSYKGRKVVNDVSIEVNQGEIVGLLGPNGAGKTTSFYMIVGLVRPNSGRVFLDDKDITRMAMYKRAQRGIGYLPQEVSVFRKMSIEDNIMSVLEMTNLTKAEREEKLESLIQEFGLGHVRKNLGQSLSGGEKRRTEIARALATDPKFILLDEPFAGVDPIAVEDIQKIVAKLKDRNIGVLITDHNVQETLSITDRTYLLFEGAILREGTAEELAADQLVRKVYLGKNFELRKFNLSDEPKVDEYGERDADFEKKIEYVSNMINLCNVVQSKITGGVRISGPGLSEVKELIKRIQEFKEYFKTEELGYRAGQLIKEINFGPASKYKLRFHSSGIWFLFLYIFPIVGWSLLVYMRQTLKQCKEDIDIAKSKLETLKQLMEKPELEEML